MSLPLELRFTDPAAPLFIDVDGGTVDMHMVFIISTSVLSEQLKKVGKLQPRNPKSNVDSDAHTLNEHRSFSAGHERLRAGTRTPNAGSPNGANITLAHGAPVAPGGTRKKPAKAAQRADATGQVRSFAPRDATPQSEHGLSVQMSMPPPSIPIHARSPPGSAFANPHGDGKARPHDAEPLFLPSSQLSQADEMLIRESGLGILDMDKAELDQLLDGDGEEDRITSDGRQAVGNLELADADVHAECGQGGSGDDDLYMSVDLEALVGIGGQTVAAGVGDEALGDSQFGMSQSPTGRCRSDGYGDSRTVSKYILWMSRMSGNAAGQANVAAQGLFRPLFED
jgi:cell cycle checkpoint control protein RAD9A